MKKGGFKGKSIKTGTLLALSLSLGSLASPIADPTPVSSPSSALSASVFDSDINIDTSVYTSPRFNRRSFAGKCNQNIGKDVENISTGLVGSNALEEQLSQNDFLSKYNVNFAQNCLGGSRSASELIALAQQALAGRKESLSGRQKIQLSCEAQPVAPTAATPTSEAPAIGSVPTTSSGLAAGTSSGNDDDASMVALHNKLRASLGKPPVAWDDGLAQSAQGAALQQPGSMRMEHTSTKNGENLFAWAGTADSGFTQAFDGWVSTAEVNQAKIPNTYNHYTQVIWGSTTKIGCARRFDAGSESGWVVCHYSPAGNVVGRTP